MKRSKDSSLTTPIYIASRKKSTWPDDDCFYLLTSNGLFLCRNNEFFKSSVPSRCWPAELGRHTPFIQLSYPKIPRELLETAVGFFSYIAENYNAEAAVILAWNKEKKSMQVMIPEQTSVVGKTMNEKVFPVGVQYEAPLPPAGVEIIGDIHSHACLSAFASIKDKNDEVHRPGLHVVVGKLNREPPEFHIEAVVDGIRSEIHASRIFEGYRQRNDHFDAAWLNKITVHYDTDTELENGKTPA